MKRQGLDGEHIVCLAYDTKHPYTELRDKGTYGGNLPRLYIPLEHYELASVVDGSEEVTKGKPMLLQFTLGQHSQPFIFRDPNAPFDQTRIAGLTWATWRDEVGAMEPDFKESRGYVSI